MSPYARSLGREIGVADLEGHSDREREVEEVEEDGSSRVR